MVLKESRSCYGISRTGRTDRVYESERMTLIMNLTIFLEVIGISPNRNFAHIDFDANTEELLLKEEEIEYSNGDVEWKSFN